MKAIRETCGELGVLPAVERSRSGEGAHVWFFFSEPLQASLARRFGLLLLTDAMARTPTLGMASYDRLFPSQDTLPKGGFGNLIALPLQRQAREHGNTLFVDDELEPFEDQWFYLQSLPLNARFTGELNSRQQDAVPAMLANDLGVLCAPPGIGKTVIATRLIAERGRSTLVLVHRKPLLEQWVKRLGEFLELEADSIGTIGGGRGQPTGKVDVAMVQSLARQKTLDQLLDGYGHIVVDECHHVPAVMTERVLQSAPARYVTGLTATPKRRDGHHPIITMQCGPVRHTIGRDATRSSRPLVLRVVRRDTPFDPQSLPPDPHIQEVFAALATDDACTELIAKDALELAAQGRHPIVLTERRDHLQQLGGHLAQGSHTLITLHGNMRTAEHRAAQAQLTRSDGDGPCIVLATGRYIGEGFDDPRLDALLLAMPIAWKGTVIQYAGRLHRAHPGKKDVLVYDYVDAELPVLRRMFAKRLCAYRSLGYELAETGQARQPTSSACNARTETSPSWYRPPEAA